MVSHKSKLLIAASVLFLFLSSAIAPAAEKEETPASVNEASISIGYQYLDIEGGGETLKPFGSLDSHVIGELDYLYFLPGLGFINLSADYDGEDYHEVRAIMDYRGSLLLEVSSDKFIRNMEHLSLPPSDGESYNPEDEDPEDEYSLDISTQKAHLKARIPNYPAHVRLDARTFSTAGDLQQIFLDENCTTSCHNISQTREVDTTTREFEVGTDAHLGFVDASYTFNTTSFEDNEDNPTHHYGILFGYRNPGEYEHNIFPDIKSYEHYVNLSTSNTGRLAATLGFALGRRENEDVDLERNYRSGAADLFWFPHQKVSVFLKYRRLEREDESPGEEVAEIREEHDLPLSYEKIENHYTATINYYPLPSWKLSGKYQLKDIDRNDEAWELPEDSTTNILNLSARWKPARELSVKFNFEDRNTDNPSYDSTPTDQQKYRASLDWQPIPVLLCQVGYLLTTGENGDSGREDDRQHIRGGLTFTFEQPVTLGFYAMWFDENVTSDLQYGLDESELAISDEGVPYDANGYQLSFQASLQATKKLALTGQISYLEATGAFDADRLNFEDVGEYSEFEATQSEFSLGIEYIIQENWEISGSLAYSRYDDLVDSDNDEEVTEVSTLLVKRW